MSFSQYLQLFESMGSLISMFWPMLGVGVVLIVIYLLRSLF